MAQPPTQPRPSTECRPLCPLRWLPPVKMRQMVHWRLETPIVVGDAEHKPVCEAIIAVQVNSQTAPSQSPTNCSTPILPRTPMVVLMVLPRGMRQLQIYAQYVVLPGQRRSPGNGCPGRQDECLHDARRLTRQTLNSRRSAFRGGRHPSQPRHPPRFHGLVSWRTLVGR